MNKIKRIFVIESVFDDTNLHKAGAIMEQQILPLCQDKGIIFERLLFLSLQDCLEGLKHIKESSSQEGATAIHIICHGADDNFLNGLVYKLSPRYAEVAKSIGLRTDCMCHCWEALRSDLTEVDTITKNNLFLSMCVCHGANIFDKCDTSFAKYVIASKNVLYLNDIKQTFVDVYKELISSSDIDPIKHIIEASNQKNNGRSQLALYEGINKIL